MEELPNQPGSEINSQAILKSSITKQRSVLKHKSHPLLRARALQETCKMGYLIREICTLKKLDIQRLEKDTNQIDPRQLFRQSFLTEQQIPRRIQRRFQTPLVAGVDAEVSVGVCRNVSVPLSLVLT